MRHKRVQNQFYCCVLTVHVMKVESMPVEMFGFAVMLFFEQIFENYAVKKLKVT